MATRTQLPRVRNRELSIGEPWHQLVRIRDLDMTESPWESQIRPYNESNVILAEPTITTELDGSDTLVYIDLTAEETTNLDSGRATWGLKAERSLFWGDLLIEERPAR